MNSKNPVIKQGGTITSFCQFCPKLEKEMFSQEKWGDQEYKKKLQELVVKDEKLVKDVIKKIKIERGLE